MAEDEPEWTPDRQVTLDALADIDAAQAVYPACRLCGQRCLRLDKYGLCSKKSEPHQDWRAGVRTEKKGAAR